MIITRETDHGTISVSNVVFAEIIIASIHRCGLENRVWPSTEKGKQVDKREWASTSDTARLIDVDYVDQNHISLEFSIIVRFGSSIRMVTRKLAEEIRRETAAKLRLDVTRIIIHIAGVKSRKVARRSTEVVYNYEAD